MCLCVLMCDCGMKSKIIQTHMHKQFVTNIRCCLNSNSVYYDFYVRLFTPKSVVNPTSTLFIWITLILLHTMERNCIEFIINWLLLAINHCYLLQTINHFSKSHSHMLEVKETINFQKLHVYVCFFFVLILAARLPVCSCVK